VNCASRLDNNFLASARKAKIPFLDSAVAGVCVCTLTTGTGLVRTKLDYGLLFFFFAVTFNLNGFHVYRAEFLFLFQSSSVPFLFCGRPSTAGCEECFAETESWPIAYFLQAFLNDFFFSTGYFVQHVLNIYFKYKLWNTER